MFDAGLSMHEFFHSFWLRNTDSRVMPKAMEAAFSDSENVKLLAIKSQIDAYAASQSKKFEQEVLAQRTRLVESEHKLQAKETKGARESQRIATRKIERALAKLADLRRAKLRDGDSRIFPATTRQ